MAHKKGVGSSKNGRESESKRLGVKDIWWTSRNSRKHHRKTKRKYTFSRRKCLWWKRSHLTRKSRWSC